LVFVERPKNGYVFLEKQRDGGENLGSFPTSLASRGLIGLGVYVFDPQYEPDLDYTPKGSGNGAGNPPGKFALSNAPGCLHAFVPGETVAACFPYR
jgi:hypothetical protein